MKTIFVGPAGKVMQAIENLRKHEEKVNTLKGGDKMDKLEMNMSKLPEHIRVSVNRYIRYGSPVGDFLSAVICNDLKESFSLADDINIAAMFDIVGFFYNEAPGNCWGSKEKMKKWIGMGGWKGPSSIWHS